MEILVRLVHDSNVLVPIVVRLEEKVTLVSLVQLLNVYMPMVVTPDGIAMLVRLEQA